MITLTNTKIEKIYNTLLTVEAASTDLDFSIRFKNKRNFKKLKEAYTNMTETFNEIFEKYWEKITKDNKQYWEFKENKEEVDEEIKKVYALEVEIELKPINIIAKQDPETWETNTGWLKITSTQMDLLEDIFEFQFLES